MSRPFAFALAWFAASAAFAQSPASADGLPPDAAEVQPADAPPADTPPADAPLEDVTAPSDAPTVPTAPAPVEPARLDSSRLDRARLDALERDLADERRAREDAAAALPSLTVTPGKGATFALPDGSASLQLRARAQLRDTLTVIPGDELKATNEVGVKTVRLIVQGNVLVPDLKYQVQLALGAGDFEVDSQSPVFDAFVEYTAARDANVRVGQFFVPFDRARTTRELALQLVDRQQVVRELTLDRDVGIMVSSSNLFGFGFLGYSLFLGGGEGRNRVGPASLEPLAVTRVVLRPFGAFDDDAEGDLKRENKVRLAVGAAGAYNAQTNRQQSTVGKTFTAGKADYAHGAVDLVFKYAGLSVTAEGLIRQANVDEIEGEVDGVKVREPTRSGTGYFVQSGFMVTDHVEITGRWDHLVALEGTDPKLVELVATQGHQVGAGVNVYLNGHAFKIQGDTFYLFGDDPAAGKALARVQLDASF